MKKIFVILTLIFSLNGCSSTPATKIIEVPIFKTPDFEMPKRPVLSSNGGKINDVTKNAEKDLLDLQNYANSLENLLNDLKSRKQ